MSTIALPQSDVTAAAGPPRRRFSPWKAWGAALLAPYGVSRETARSIILIEDGRVYLRSTATLRIARRLSWPWSMAQVFLLVPVPLRDFVYRCVAAVRQRIAGSRSAR